ncbi:MAG: two-component regulator propeller domain-containing protein [Limisphaera sp.]
MFRTRQTDLAWTAGFRGACARRWAWWTVLVWLLGIRLGAGEEAAPAYFFQVWGTDEGLPQSSVAALAQTREGYLWLGTYAGLVRFDGVRFVVFDAGNTPGLSSSRVTALYEDAEGRLWVGHENGSVSVRESGRFRPVPVPPGWGTGKVLAIVADEQEQIWLVDEEGLLVRVSDGRRLLPETGGGRGLVSVARGANKEVWIARNGRVSRLWRGEVAPVAFEKEGEPGFVQGICASRRGGFWVSYSGELARWAGGRWQETRNRAPWYSTGVPVMLELSDGTVAAATTEAGLFLVPPRGQALHFTRTNGLPQDWVRSLCEDHEGNLWAGVGSAGLVAVRPSKVWTPAPPDRWQGRAVLCVMADRRGALWIGTEGAGLYRWHEGRWERFAVESGLSNLFVWSVAEDASGQMWVGTWGGGVFVQQADGRFDPPAGLEVLTPPVLAILPDPDGTVWLGTGEGLIEYRAGQTRRYGRAEGLEAPDVRTLLRTPDGAVWFGMSGGGLGRLHQGQLRQWRRSDGLPSDYVQALWRDEQGALWLGTAGDGLVRFFQEAFAAVGPSQGLPSGVICHIAPDDSGSIWLASYNGLIRVAKAELDRVASGSTEPLRSLVYGRGEGMPTLECSGGLQPAGCRTADGRLWFATQKGLVGVDPHVVKINRQPPPVVIEEVRVNGRLTAEPAAGAHAVRIPPGRHRLEFRYTGLSFTAPEKVRFRFRLAGVDRDWTEAGTERTAVYQYLPPGDYVFHVIACNNDGIWNSTGARVAFVVEPFVWQTWWFRLGAALAGAGAVALGVARIARARLRRKLERLERQQALERERARIAKDMHDELGASLTRITLLSQTARAELHDPQTVAEGLDRIYTTARELTRALDEIVWAVNPQHDTLDSLATYLGRFAQEFLAAARVRCRLDVPVHLPAWPLTAEVRHNLFLAFKEALHNAVKHSGAAEVRIALETEAHGFVLQVEDNGRGFHLPPPGPTGPDSSSPRGNGLHNMRQRLADIGGSCHIESTPGRGTRILFRVPVRGH